MNTLLDIFNSTTTTPTAILIIIAVAVLAIWIGSIFVAKTPKKKLECMNTEYKKNQAEADVNIKHIMANIDILSHQLHTTKQKLKLRESK